MCNTYFLSPSSPPPLLAASPFSLIPLLLTPSRKGGDGIEGENKSFSRSLSFVEFLLFCRVTVLVMEEKLLVSKLIGRNLRPFSPLFFDESFPSLLPSR